MNRCTRGAFQHRAVIYESNVHLEMFTLTLCDQIKAKKVSFAADLGFFKLPFAADQFRLNGHSFRVQVVANLNNSCR